MPELEKLASLSQLIEGCPDAVVLIDRIGRIVWSNPAAAKMFGYADGQMLGQPVEELMPEPTRSEHQQYLERYERTGEARAIGMTRAVHGQRRDGEVFPIELSVMRTSADAGARYAAFIRDVSETHSLHRRLIDKERLATLGMSVSVFVHEIGNPLNSLAIQAQLVERRLRRENHALSDRARIMVQEVRRLGDLLDEFRSFGRPPSLELAPVELKALVDEVVQMLAASAAQCRIELTNQVGETSLPQVHGHRDKLKQVVMNLCKNAVEAMPNGGQLRLSARAEGSLVTLSIEDTAGGLPAGFDVFQPFKTTKDRGLGLGLSIVRQIVDGHGGKLVYDSVPGAGTRFLVTLPIETLPDTPAQ